MTSEPPALFSVFGSVLPALKGPSLTRKAIVYVTEMISHRYIHQHTCITHLFPRRVDINFKAVHCPFRVDTTDLKIDYFANRLNETECHLLIVVVAAGFRFKPTLITLLYVACMWLDFPTLKHLSCTLVSVSLYHRQPCPSLLVHLRAHLT
jgi:hypothetical protein